MGSTKFSGQSIVKLGLEQLNKLSPSKRVFSGQLNNIADSGIYAYAKGRMFGAWIDLTSNGLNAGGLIETPGYIIESILRDECFVERDLIADSANNGAEVIINGSNYGTYLASDVDDYYNNAYMWNITQNSVYLITDFVGASGTFTIDNVSDTFNATDKVVITNIQGNTKIDEASFDLVGNTTNGSRKDWKFARSINSKTDAYSLINSLCYESFTMLHSVNGVYKLIALDTGTEVATLTKPLITLGQPLIGVDFTPLSEVYSSFRLKYNYNYAKGEYMQEYFCDKNGSTAGASGLSAYETNCLNAETNYHVKKKFEYSANWIYDSATALAFIKKLMDWFTIQRMIINWSSSITDSLIALGEGYAMLDIGDLVKVDYPSGKVLTAGIGYGGQDYVANDILTLTQTGASGCTLRIDSVGGGGEVLTMTLLTGGQGYFDTIHPSSTNPLNTTTDSALGLDATINVLTVSPPSIIPLSKNNSAKFMIYGKQITPRNGQPSIDFALLEMV